MVDREAVAAAARDELARRRLTDFGALMVPNYERARHIDAICDLLEALERRDVRRAMIFTPPRHSKTTHVSRMLPAWWLGRRPDESIILASYGAELAEGNSRAARGMVADPRYPFPGVTVSAESSAVGRWHTNHGGGVIAAGVGGGLTGFGAHALVIDDPIRDRADADSKAVRDSTWLWLTQTALTRLMPNGVVLLTLTRWSDDDVASRLLNSDGADEWEVLSLPAIAEDDDPIGRDVGEALWPGWFPPETLNGYRRDLGERAFAALYQQRPAPAEGALFKRAWLDNRYDRVPEALKVVTAIDASFGKSVASDYSAVVTVGCDGRDFYVLHATRGRWDFNGLCRQIEAEARDWNPDGPILVEDAAAGSSALQELKRTTGLNVIPVKPDGSKLARAEAASPAFESGRVFFPSKTSRWRDELIEEVASFPAGRHDDFVDALVYAVRRLRPVVKSGGTVAGVVTSNSWLRDSQRRAADRQSRDAARRRRQALRLPRGLFDPRYS